VKFRCVLRQRGENPCPPKNRDRAEGVSNGSGGIKLRSFDEVVEEDEELPHESRERYFFGLTGRRRVVDKMI